MNNPKGYKKNLIIPGSDVLLVCPVSGYPIHKVEWSTQHQIIKEICQTVHKLKRLFTYSKTFPDKPGRDPFVFFNRIFFL